MTDTEINAYFPSSEWVESILSKIVEKFIKKDWQAMVTTGLYEPSMSHRIAVYLEKKFEKYYSRQYNVDCEYNKEGNNDKVNSKRRKVRPDIIVHKRRESNNILVVEVKKNGYKSQGGMNEG